MNSNLESSSQIRMSRIRRVSLFFQFICVLVFLVIAFLAVNLALFGFQARSTAADATLDAQLTPPPVRQAQPVQPTRVTTFNLGSQGLFMNVEGNLPATLISGWLSLAFLALGIALLYRLFGFYRRGLIFERETVLSYRWIAVWLLGGWALSHALQFLQWLGPPTASVHMRFVLDEMFFGGVLLFLISWIMEEGRKLQEEQSLTV